MANQERDDAFEALVAAMKARPQPIALLGAGTSVDSGYPTWDGLLELLAGRASEKIAPRYGAVLKELRDPPWIAEEYRRVIGEHAFCDLIASEFGPKPTLGPVLRLIVQVGFRHLLTTNYDPSIERAYAAMKRPLTVIDWREDANLRQFFLELSRDGGTPYLLYLHGRYYDPANVILTESSYAARYVRSDDAQRKLFAILITQPVVFIGFSVNDPDLNQLMREVNARLGSGNPHHFALIGYRHPDERQLIRNRFQGKFGIEPVFYEITKNSDNTENHGGLIELLTRLHTTVHGWAPALGEPPAPAAAEAAPGSAEALPPPDPLDPHKGRWGGSPRRNGRVLTVENPTQLGEVFGFDLVVRPERESDPPLTGEVVFHLHDTFRRPDPVVPVRDGQARLRIQAAYGVFTVGAEADDRNTQLELDLAGLADVFPDWFRAR